MIDYSKLENFRKKFIPRRLSLSAVAAFLLLVGCVYLFAVVTESWMDQELLYRIDQGVYFFIANNIQPPQIAVAELITHFGDFLVALGICLALTAFLYWRSRWNEIAMLALAMGLGQPLLYTLKAVFARARPMGPLTDALNVAESFPSGHTFTATVLYGLLLVLAWRRLEGPAVRGAAIILCAALILGVGLSRVALSVHWTSDVLGGWPIGLAWLVCSVQIVRLSTGRTAERPLT